MNNLKQRKYFLTEVIVKVGVFGIAHVVDEDQTTALGVDAFQGDIQLVNHSLQSNGEKILKQHKSIKQFYLISLNIYGTE